MPHMQPEILCSRWLVIECTAGTTVVPLDVVDLKPEATRDEKRELLQPYAEGDLERDKDWSYEIVDGWCSRLSAPGYTDCTDWDGPFDSRLEAAETLREGFEDYFSLDEETAKVMEHYGVLYEGDVNVEHGGVFYTLNDFGRGYVSAVRVYPRELSDAKLEVVVDVDCLTVLVDSAHLPDALKSADLEMDRLTFGDAAASGDLDAQRKIVGACVMHGVYDPDDHAPDGLGWSRTVQLGHYERELGSEDGVAHAWCVDQLYDFVLKALGKGGLSYGGADYEKS